MNNVIERINNLKDEFIESVTKEIGLVEELETYEIVWKQFEDIAAEKIRQILERDFPEAQIILPKSKSTYPDVKLILNNKSYAIDIKCAEIQKQPWYDIARIDTFLEKRFNVYQEEWEFLIQYDSETKTFNKAFFGLLREFVGYNPHCKGIKFRPYDGKIRPKTWEEIENNTIFWPTDELFLEGLKNSQIERWRLNIKKTLVPVLNDAQKQEFKLLFE